MKSIDNSFLFFCFIFFFLNNSDKLIAQGNVDSTQIYYDKILKPKTEKDLVDGYKYYLNYKEEKLKNQDTLGAVQGMRLVSIAMKNAGLLYESENIAVQALRLLDNLKNNESVFIDAKVGLYNHLGIINKSLQNYPLALDYYDRVIKTAQTKKQVYAALNNRANIYLETKQFELAKNDYITINKSHLDIKDELRIARYLDNLGFVQSKLNESEALSNLEKALSIRQKENSVKGQITSYLHLSKYFKDRGDKRNAIMYVDKALEIAKKTGNKFYEMNVLSSKIDLVDDKEISRYKYLNDSIVKAKQFQENKYASSIYEYENEKRRAKEFELEKEKEKSKKIVYQAIGGLILLSALSFIYMIRVKHKKDKIKEVYLSETRMSKKIHDELANDVSDIMNFVENDLDVSTDKKSPLLNNLEDIYLRTRDISTETASIDLDNFSKSLKYLLMQHNRSGTKVITNDIETINWLKIPDYKKMAIYRSLQELMVNMKKHSQAKTVSVIFKTKSKENEIRYTDDGLGGSVQKLETSGLQNVESRMNSIGGTFNFDTSKGHGFKASLKFKS